ncbi:MAG: TonB-dependent receptor [Salinimicrobium sp.]
MLKTISLRSSIFLFVLVLSTSLWSQQIDLRGVINDSLQQPLPYTNIIATPFADEGSITFAISDELGRYKLDLVRDITYKLEITHLGFSKGMDTITILENTTRNFTLYESMESLEEVIIEQQMAVIVKEDTITYRVKQFKTGEERKLREVLKKLPGVEVDREGNVTVNGKRVTKLMVEGKTFFTGDTKLGVNNIPADAVAEVQALDNYSEVAFLKGLEDSDKMALNIKLKQGKKKFVFGDIEAGAGIEERYLFHPTLFYYSPKTAVNVIGDFNNIGEKSFTMSDYINFEGGYASLMDGSNSFSNIYNSDFAKFLGQQDFIYSRNEFGAGSLSQEISPNLQLDAYSIASGGKVETRTTNDITYLTDAGLDEFRETTTENNVFFTLSKLKLRYQPNAETDVSYDALFKTSSGDAKQRILSQTPLNLNQTQIIQKPESYELNQFLNYNRQFSYKHTTTLTGNYQYHKSENMNGWFFDRPVFSEIIPFINDGDVYNLLQNSSYQNHHARVDLKHYWVMNNLNHLYPIAGVNLMDQQYKTVDYQKLNDSSINYFANSGFNNDLDFRLLDTYAGFEFKMKRGDLILKPGITYHLFDWRIHQFMEEIVNKSKGALLPALMAKYEINSSENLTFNYNLRSSFTDATSYANRLRLINFNQLFRGNEELENELSHSLSLRYYKFNMYRGLFVNGNLNYTRRANSIRSTSIIEGIDQVATLFFTDMPENSYYGNASIAKQVRKLKFTLSGSANLSDYTRVINNEKIDYNSQNYSYTVKGETRFKKLPNLELGYRQDFSNFESDNFSNNFTQISPYANLDYDFLKDLILKANYAYNYYENQNTNEINRFQLGNASLFYNKENNPWSFEIDVKNVFDVYYRNSNTFNEFLITDQRIYIQPRTFLFKAAYKI